MTRPRLAWRGAVPRRYEAVLNRCEAVLKEYDCGLGAVHKLCQPILEGSKLFESLNVFEYSYNFLYKKLFGHFFVSNIWYKYRVSFFTGPPPKSSKAKKLIWARLGVSGTIYVNVVSPILGFQYLNFLGEAQWKKNSLYIWTFICVICLIEIYSDICLYWIFYECHILLSISSPSSFIETRTATHQKNFNQDIWQGS